MRNTEEQTIKELIGLLHDQPFGVSQDIFRNVKTLTKRCSNQGFSFVTKVLPQIGKCFDKAISGNTAFNVTTFLKKCHGTCLPHFLGSALRRVFSLDGQLLELPCVATIKWLRTLFQYAYKIEVPFDDDKIESFKESFLNNEEKISTIQLSNFEDTVTVVSGMRSMLRSFDNLKPSEPKFGPGVSANCDRNSKYLQYVPIHSELRRTFGYGFFHLRGEHWLSDYIRTFYALSCWYLFLLDDSNPVRTGSNTALAASRIIFVPKDSRGPRVICAEDSRLMYAQKSLQVSLYSRIESVYPFRGRVNFTDQSINRSKTFDKRYSTIDLKDASDLVSYDLVRSVFPPKLFAYMDACRSRSCDLKENLSKFAPMGSALCFPVLALCVYTSVCSYVSAKYGIRRSDVDVYVYGDDLIVPNEYANDAITALEAVGLAVNKDKSFINSRFTESCGQDTFDVSDVTPIRKRQHMLKKHRVRYKGRTCFDNVKGLCSNVALVNGLLRAGFINAANAVKSSIRKSGFSIPYGLPESPYVNYNVEPRVVRAYNQAGGFEVNGKLRALRVVDPTMSFAHEHDSLHGLRRTLLEGGMEDTILSLELSARSAILQPKNFIPWGTSYS